MRLPSLEILSALLLASELTLALRKRAAPATGRDRWSLPLLWTVIGLSISLGFELRAGAPSGRVPMALLFYFAGLAFFAIGLIIRWVAILHLGRFFTVDVAIAQDHRLITTGPYRYVRHLSYTDALLVFLGFSLCTLNFYAMAAILIPISGAFLWRIHVEETALRATFGNQYREYATRTGRLIPLLS
ncbi:MAG: isoprenylcysteine carboxylmethyltransferase family protein [Verrucomicrobiota bacterium]